MDAAISVAVYRLNLLSCNKCLTRYELDLDRERNFDCAVCLFRNEGNSICYRLAFSIQDLFSGCLVVKSAFHHIGLAYDETLILNSINQCYRLSESNDVSLCIRIGKSCLNDRVEVQELTTDAVLRLPVDVIDCCVNSGCRDLEGIRVGIFDIVLGSYCFLDIVLADTKSSVLISLILFVFYELTDDLRAILILIDSELSTGEELILVVDLVDIDRACLVFELEFLYADLEINSCRILSADRE